MDVAQRKGPFMRVRAWMSGRGGPEEDGVVCACVRVCVCVCVVELQLQGYRK